MFTVNEQHKKIRHLAMKNISYSFIVFAICFSLSGCGSQSSREDMEHLSASIRHIQVSFAKESEYSGDGTVGINMPKETYETVLTLRRMALEEARKVNPKSLSQVDSEMPSAFSSYYLRGLELWNSGIEDGDFLKANRGMMLINSWGDYYQAWRNSV